MYEFLNSFHRFIFKFSIIFIKKIPYSEPSTDDLVKIKIYDYDMMTKDELVGICSLRKQDILEGKVSDILFYLIFVNFLKLFC